MEPQLKNAERINYQPHILAASERQELSLILGDRTPPHQINRTLAPGPVRRPSSYWRPIHHEEFLSEFHHLYPTTTLLPPQAHSPSSPTMCPARSLPPPSPLAAHAHDPSNDNCMCVDCYDLEPVPPGPPPNTTPPLTPPRHPQRRAPRRPEYLRLMDAQLAFRDWHHIPVYFPTSTRQMLMFSD